MKQFWCLTILLWSCLSASTQTTLAISTDRTTSLVFPFAILHVDRGTTDVLAEPVREAPGILLVKAAAKNFPETNLSVVTEDGSVYSFTVCYANRPSALIYHVPIENRAAISTYANGILDNPQRVAGVKDRHWGMQASIKGIYIKGDVIYYQLNLRNNTTVGYNIDLLRFYIRDRKKGKRTGVQENDLTPLYVAGNSSKVSAKSDNVIVVALDKYTIPDAKYLAVQILEKNGGRHLLLKITNRSILKAVQLPDLK